MFFMGNKNDKFASTINYQKSDPNDVGSIGKTLSNDYMIVDDFDYLPYNKSTYDEIFINSTGKEDANCEDIYGLYNIYNSNPDELTDEEVDDIRMNVINECFIAQYVFEFPTTFLMKYITNYEERNFYSCEEVLARSSDARTTMATDVRALMLAAEGYLDQNETVILAQTPENENNGIHIEVGLIDKEYDLYLFNSVTDFWAIHDAKTRIVGAVSYDGKEYTMKVKYYIFDYYDWNEAQDVKFGLVSDSQLYQLCRSGKARFFENWGIYETQYTWTPTEDSRQEALSKEKENLKKKAIHI